MQSFFPATSSRSKIVWFVKMLNSCLTFLFFPNTSAVLGPDPKSFGGVNQMGESKVIVYLIIKQQNKNRVLGKEPSCELQGLYLLFSFFMISQPVPSPTLHSRATDRPCGCWMVVWMKAVHRIDRLGPLIQCHRTWNWPSLGLKDVFYIHLSGYKYVRAHLHHGDLRYYSLLSHQLLKTANPSLLLLLENPGAGALWPR